MKSIFFLLCVLVAVREGLSQTQSQTTTGASLPTAIDTFSQNLHQKVATNNENIVFSPLSIHLALSMTNYGARNETEKEMSSALGLSAFSNRQEYSAAYKNIITQINSPSAVTISTANALYINPKFTILDNYKTDLANYYSAKVDSLDFQTPGGPEVKINEFVANNTKNQINNIVPAGSLNALTALVIVNTVFFNGTFEKEFKDSQTQPRSFNKGGQVVQINTMYDERTINIKRNIHGADVGEIKFKGDRYSLFLVVPNAVDGLKNVEKTLANKTKYAQFFTNLQAVRVQLQVPKFKIETSLQLKAFLQLLGIQKAFDQAKANFTGISTTSNLVITEALHKAMIEVTEKGTVAAAATAVVIGLTSVQQPPTEKFFADRPFLVFLRDNIIGYNLFQAAFRG